MADTGHTLALVKDFCVGKVAEVRCAVLYEKPRSVVKCEYVWRATDLWIEFPWSDAAADRRRPRAARPATLIALADQVPRMTRAVLRPLAPTRRRRGTWPRR